MKEYKVMVLNLGSTSYKFKLFFKKDVTVQVLAEGGFENIGSATGKWFIRMQEKPEQIGEKAFADHLEAFELSMEILKKEQILSSFEELDAVGYKSVHAGTVSGARQINEELLDIMEQYAAFAPAHNPVYIRMMKQVKQHYPNLCQIGYFETSFHASIPEKRVTYGVPKFWKEQLGIRRYGFHGSSHGYIAWKMKTEHPEYKKVISLHLGGSSSVCAIENGRSIASSMGATPQSGIFQNNRVGDFDLFCLPVLMEYYHGDWQQILKVLSSQSGLYGVSGVSNDLRLIQEAANAGNSDAMLAIDSYVDGIVGYIGMFTAYLKGLDAIVFTGGIGKGSKMIRDKVCHELEYMGIHLTENENPKDGCISTDESSVAVYVLQTNEEQMVFEQCMHILQSEGR